MTLTWIHGAVFAGTTLFVISLFMLAHEVYFRYRQLVAERMRELFRDEEVEQQTSIFKDHGLLSVASHARKETWSEWLQNLIDQSGLTWSLQKFFNLCVASGLLLSLGLAIRIGWLGSLFLPVGAVLPLTILYARRHWRRRQLCRQLPEVFQIISRAVRAGQTVPAALQIIADDFDPPISEEFTLCYEQQNLGMSRESVLKRLAVRTGVMELQIFVVALLVQSRSGGDLVELLDNLSAMATKRLKLRERVRALTGEGRMQALILMLLPVVALVCLVVFSPDYAQVLLERPGLLCLTATAQVVGAMWIRRIVEFEA